MCGFRCCGSTLPVVGSITLIRASETCPCTVLPPNTPGPSKRVRFGDSVFETYSFPLIGLRTMLNRIVPTWSNGAGGTVARVPASTAKTSWSGRSNGTTAFQSRPSTSRHWPDGGSNLTIRLVSGAGAPAAFVLGPGSPPGAVAPGVTGGKPGVVHGPAAVNPSQTASSWIAVVWLPDMNAATYTVEPVASVASARGVSA